MQTKVIDLFKQYCDERGETQKTITDYSYHIKRFLSLFPSDKRLSSYTLSDIKHWISHERSRTSVRTNRRPAANTINIQLYALRRFFKFLQERGSIEQDPTLQIIPLKHSKPLPRVLNRDQVQRLLRSIPQRKQTDRLIFNLMYQAGLRPSEACNIRIFDVDFQTNKITIKGKGDKTRVLPVEAEYLKPVKAYLRRREPPSQDAPLFLQPCGRPYTTRTLSNHCRGYAKRARVRATPHTLRHSFATHMLEAGFPITHIQAYLGHEVIGTTQVYTHVSDPELTAKYSCFSRILRV